MKQLRQMLAPEAHVQHFLVELQNLRGSNVMLLNLENLTLKQLFNKKIRFFVSFITHSQKAVCCVSVFVFVTLL